MKKFVFLLPVSLLLVVGYCFSSKQVRKRRGVGEVWTFPDEGSDSLSLPPGVELNCGANSMRLSLEANGSGVVGHDTLALLDNEGNPIKGCLGVYNVKLDAFVFEFAETMKSQCTKSEETVLYSLEYIDIMKPPCLGIDHGGMNWTVKDGKTISGDHCNIQNFVIKSGDTVAVEEWSGQDGNTGMVTVAAENIYIRGTLDASGKGFPGGASPRRERETGNSGNSIYGSRWETTMSNRGGGGGGWGDTSAYSEGYPGGGGGYGTEGSSCRVRSGRSLPYSQVCGAGGETYGSKELYPLYLGSGGGSGGNDHVLSDNPVGGRGGNGGGVVHLRSSNLLSITGKVLAEGEPGEGDTGVTSCDECPPACNSGHCTGSSTTSCYDFSGPGGGGSGGSLHLKSPTVHITGEISAAGGHGGYGGYVGCGGSGGRGRIRIDYNIMNGLIPEYVSSGVYNETTQATCNGTDHNGEDWAPVFGSLIHGVHCNIRKFQIYNHSVVFVSPYLPFGSPDLGKLYIFAESIEINGTLNGIGMGYPGGSSPSAGFQSGAAGSSPKNGGGGGGLGDISQQTREGHPGGGGGYGANGTTCIKRLPTLSPDACGQGGGSYGDEELSILYMGSGGGSGGNDNTLVDNPRGGRGGNGGGAIYLHATSYIFIDGPVKVDGENGDGDVGTNCHTCPPACNTNQCKGASNTSCYDFSGPGGGGSGGAIFLQALKVNIEGHVSVDGGRGGYGGGAACGGDGGRGRMRIDGNIVTGNYPDHAYVHLQIVRGHESIYNFEVAKVAHHTTKGVPPIRIYNFSCNYIAYDDVSNNQSSVTLLTTERFGPLHAEHPVSFKLARYRSQLFSDVDKSLTAHRGDQLHFQIDLKQIRTAPYELRLRLQVLSCGVEPVYYGKSIPIVWGCKKTNGIVQSADTASKQIRFSFDATSSLPASFQLVCKVGMCNDSNEHCPKILPCSSQPPQINIRTLRLGIFTIKRKINVTSSSDKAAADACDTMPCSYKCAIVGGSAVCICPNQQDLRQDGITCQEISAISHATFGILLFLVIALSACIIIYAGYRNRNRYGCLSYTQAPRVDDNMEHLVETNTEAL